MARVAIVFYSHKGMNYTASGIRELKVGNTAVAARYVQELTGGDLFELEPVQDYPFDYQACTDRAKQEQQQGARPALKAVPDVAGYDTVVLAYPNWWGTVPMLVHTFLEAQDLRGKTVLPLCTNEGSGLGHSEADLRQACPGAAVKKGLALRGSAVGGAKDEVAAWLQKQLPA